jgi:hypothetical protein
MTTELAKLLSLRIQPLPFVQRVAGLARPYEEEQVDGDRKHMERWPVPLGLLMKPEEASNRYLLPDPTTASIFFFEDNGTIPHSFGPGVKGYESSLRLLGWLNPDLLTLPITDVRLNGALIEAFSKDLPVSPIYRNLMIGYRVLTADASLWAKYTYRTKLLYAPYQLVGIDLTCRYILNPACLVDPLPEIKESADCPVYIDPSVPQYNQTQYTPDQFK